MARVQLMISTDASDRLELMLVSAVTTVLSIRLFLHLTGYPQIGGGGLHIAHLLWGGLGMAAALVIALSALGRRPFTVAALLGGIGLGFFIDEIGKFVTSDNDYFFKPAVALMYIVFLALVVAMRVIRSRPLGEDAALANALTMIADAQHRGMDATTQQAIVAMLDRAHAEGDIAPAIRQAVLEAPVVAPDDMNVYERNRARLARRYAAFAETRLFRRLTLIGSITYLALTVPSIAVIVIAARDDGTAAATGYVSLAVAASLLVAALTAIGTYAFIRRDTLRGLRWIRNATVMSLIVSQPIAFWEQEFAALPGFVLSLLLFTALNYAIRREEERVDAPPAAPEPTADAR